MDHLATAVQIIGEAVGGIESALGQVRQTFDYPDIETDDIFAFLDQADEELDRAASEGLGDRQTAIDPLRNFSRWLRAIAQGLNVYDAVIDRLQSGRTAYSENRFDDAIDASQNAENSVNAVLDHLERAEQRLADIDMDQLVSLVVELEDADPSELREDLREFEMLVTEFSQSAEAMVHYTLMLRDLADGTQSYRRAEELGQQNLFDEARSAVDTASEAFSSALESAETGAEHAPGPLRIEFTRFICGLGYLRKAASHLETAIDEAASGDDDAADTAYEQAQEAESMVDQC